MELSLAKIKKIGKIMNEEIIGRADEKKKLAKIMNSKDAEFLAVYGRRRVGKTFLVRHFFKGKGVYFELAGEKDSAYKVQLINFYRSVQETFKPDLPIKIPATWKEAFSILTVFIEAQPENKKVIIFLDELPWMASRRSGLIQALDYEWNRKWSNISNLILVVCGSAASWVLEKLIHAKGGLHNRITDTIHLKPFSLGEADLYLKSRGINLKPMQVLELYMVMGGIPHYLRQVEKGKSSTQIINSLCFRRDGFLFSEFSRLYKSLFDQSEVHNRITRQIVKKRNGISRDELLRATGFSSGGTFQKRLLELEESGFIDVYVPFGKRKKDLFIKVVDEYTLFFLHWIDPLVKKSSVGYNPNYWLNLSKKPKYLSWAGYAFEAICMKHADRIMKSLGIANLAGEIGSWRFIPAKKSKERGAQIDLLIDRTDNSINLCEIKFSDNKFSIDKSYAKNLINKIEVFEEKTKTKKQIFLTMITTMGIKKNIWSEDLVDSEVILKDIF